MAEEDNEPQEDGAEPPKKSKKKLIIILAVVLVLLLGAVIGFVALGGSAEEEKDAEAEPVEISFSTATLAPIVVNLTNSNSFVKVVVVLEFDPKLVVKPGSAPAAGGINTKETEDALPGVLEERLAMIKDGIITLISSKSREFALSQDGKETLKEELMEAVNDATALDEGPIVGVYFMDYIVQ